MDAVSKRRSILVVLVITAVMLMVLLNSATWIMKVLFPVYHRDIIFKYSEEYGVDPYLIAAIIRAESKFYHKATSAKCPRPYADISITGMWAAQSWD